MGVSVGMGRDVIKSKLNQHFYHNRNQNSIGLSKCKIASKQININLRILTTTLAQGINPRSVMWWLNRINLYRF